MLIEKILKLLDSHDPEIKSLVEAVLDAEQSYISFELKTNDKRLREIKQEIRREIDSITGEIDET